MSLRAASSPGSARGERGLHVPVRVRALAPWPALALVTTAACTTTQAADQRTWFAVPFGAVDLDQDARGGADDGLSAGVDGGLDLNTDLVRASWEIGVSWSDHDLPASGDLQLVRATTGLRLAARGREVPFGAYVRGGGLWSGEDSDDTLANTDDDQLGWYAGAGLEWWYSDVACLGPFVTRFHGDEDDSDDTWYGIAARFYVGERR